MPFVSSLLAMPDESSSIPSVVVHLVTVAWGIHDVEPQADAVFLNDCSPGVSQSPRFCADWSVPCDTAWISVVDRTGSEGVMRPLESIRWDANMVLMSVDLPSPVWPVALFSSKVALLRSPPSYRRR